MAPRLWPSHDGHMPSSASNRGILPDWLVDRLRRHIIQLRADTESLRRLEWETRATLRATGYKDLAEANSGEQFAVRDEWSR